MYWATYGGSRVGFESLSLTKIINEKPKIETMIKIKIEAASGADLRAQLLALLGDVNSQTVSTSATAPGLVEKVKEALGNTEQAQAPAMEIVKDEKAATSKKLSAKEQKKLDDAEAAKNAEATNQEAGTDDVPAEEVKTEESGEVKVTLDILREMVLRLSRNGLKEETKKIIVGFKVERITELTEDQYPAFFAAIKPNYDTLTEEQA